MRRQLEVGRVSVARPNVAGPLADGFAADPFLVVDHEDRLWMFYEEAEGSLGRVVAREVSEHVGSGGSVRLGTRVEALDRRPIHTSFPYVFRNSGQYWMLVESGRRHGDGSLQLFRTIPEIFPRGWCEASTVLSRGGAGSWDERAASDAVLIPWLDGWLLIYSGQNAQRRSRIGLAFAEQLAGPYKRIGRLVPDVPKWAAGHQRLAGGVTELEPPFFAIPVQVASADVDNTYDQDTSDLQVGMLVAECRSDGKWIAHVQPEPLVGPATGTSRWDSALTHHVSFAHWRGKLFVAYDGRSSSSNWAIAVIHLPAYNAPIGLKGSCL